MTTTSTESEHAMNADRWQRREAAADRMTEIAVNFFDPATEYAGWFISGWGRSIVHGQDVRRCREWLSCRASNERLDEFHALLTRERLVGSISSHGDTVDFTPAEMHKREGS